MMTSKDIWLAGLCVGGLLMACGSSGANPPPTTDVPVATDTPITPMDTPPSGDTPGSDTLPPPTDRPVSESPPPQDRPPVDRPPPVDPCMSARDLAMSTPGADGAIHVMGDSTTAPPIMLGALPEQCTSGGEKGRPVVFRYTMRATALLRVSTVNPGTDPMLDTIVAVLPTCTQLATPITCNDDLGRGMLRSTATSPMPIMMGTTVFVVVGIYGASAEDTEGGPFELSIRELAAIPAGMPCRAGDICATGASCLRVGDDPLVGQCVNDGAVGGLCRTAAGMMACDMGFTCSQAMPTAMTPGTCRTLVATGTECDRTGRTNGCMTGATCLASAMDAMRFVCTADGSRGARCRTDSPRCDMGLECSAATPPSCREIVTMAGAACDLAGRASVCGMGLSCAPNAMFTAGTCAALGTAAGAACRTDGARCDAMLTCSTMTGAGLCRTTVAAGMPCDTRFGSTVCATGSSCIQTAPTATTCLGTTPEMEPNNTPMTAQMPVTMTTVYAGALSTGADVDCFRVTVPAMGGVFLETNFPLAPTCPLGTMAMPNPDTIVTLYSPSGMMLAENDDSRMGVCSLIDPAVTAAARGLAAGTYVACVSGYGMMPVAIPNYTLTIRITAP